MQTTIDLIRRVLLIGLWLASCAGLIALGAWQQERGAIKHQRHVEFAERRTARPVALDSLLPSVEQSDRLLWRRVSADGHYLDFHVLLDNRVVAGRVGYEVLSPFRTSGGRIVLINRGWLAAPGSRDQLPDIVAPADPTTLNGFFGELPIVGLEFNAAAGDAEWLSPRVVRVQRIELDGLASLMGMDLWPGILYLDEAQLGAYNVNWPPPGDDSVRHRVYAVQWFAMAAMLAALGLWNLRRNRHRKTSA